MNFLQINLAVSKSLIKSQSKKDIIIIGKSIKKQLIEQELSENERRSLRELLSFSRRIYLER